MIQYNIYNLLKVNLLALSISLLFMLLWIGLGAPREVGVVILFMIEIPTNAVCLLVMSD